MSLEEKNEGETKKTERIAACRLLATDEKTMGEKIEEPSDRLVKIRHVRKKIQKVLDAKKEKKKIAHYTVPKELAADTLKAALATGVTEIHLSICELDSVKVWL